MVLERNMEHDGIGMSRRQDVNETRCYTEGHVMNTQLVEHTCQDVRMSKRLDRAVVTDHRDPICKIRPVVLTVWHAQTHGRHYHADTIMHVHTALDKTTNPHATPT